MPLGTFACQYEIRGIKYDETCTSFQQNVVEFTLNNLGSVFPSRDVTIYLTEKNIMNPWFKRTQLSSFYITINRIIGSSIAYIVDRGRPKVQINPIYTHGTSLSYFSANTLNN
jgi:hypothetical protein